VVPKVTGLETLISDIELLLLETVLKPLPLLFEAPEVVPNPEFWVLFVFPNPRVVDGAVVFVVALVLAVVVAVVALKPPKVKDGVEVVAVVVEVAAAVVVAGFEAPNVKVFAVVLVVLGVVVEAVVVV